MDTIIAFVLGVFSVAFIAIAVIAVWAAFKVNKIKKQLNELDTTVGLLDQSVARQFDDFKRERDSQLDSRLDKLERKIREDINLALACKQ